jgi:hypothetical protein
MHSTRITIRLAIGLVVATATPAPVMALRYVAQGYAPPTPQTSRDEMFDDYVDPSRPLRPVPPGRIGGDQDDAASMLDDDDPDFGTKATRAGSTYSTDQGTTTGNTTSSFSTTAPPAPRDGSTSQ